VQDTQNFLKAKTFLIFLFTQDVDSHDRNVPRVQSITVFFACSKRHILKCQKWPENGFATADALL
jgi:hypothetical protein